MTARLPPIVRCSFSRVKHLVDNRTEWTFRFFPNVTTCQLHDARQQQQGSADIPEPEAVTS